MCVSVCLCVCVSECAFKMVAGQYEGINHSPPGMFTTCSGGQRDVWGDIYVCVCWCQVRESS